MSQYKKDLISSFVFLIFGAFVLISVPLTIDDPGVSVMGPRVFPYFIGTCMVLLSLALLAITLVKHRKAAGSDTKTTYTTDEERKTALRDEFVPLPWQSLFWSIPPYLSSWAISPPPSWPPRPFCCCSGSKRSGPTPLSMP